MAELKELEMKSEYRGILAIALSAAVFILWYTVIAPPKPVPALPQQQVAEETQAKAAEVADKEVTKEATKTAGGTGAADPQASFPIKTNTIETGLATIEFSTDGAAPVSWKLKNYQTQSEKETVPVNLVYPESFDHPAMDLRFVGANFAYPEKPHYRLVEAKEDELIYRWESPQVEIIKTIKLSKDSYLADVSIKIKNDSDQVITERPLLSWSGAYLPPKKEGFFSFLKQPPPTNKTPVYYLNGKTKRETNIGKISDEEKTGTLYWAGLEDRYFLSVVIPRDASSQISADIGALDLKDDKGGKLLYSGAALATTSIPPGEKVTHKFSVYAGPKEIGQLKAVGVRLEEAIDYGWFTVIAVPILYCLKFLHEVVRNYGIAIILLTIFIKLLLHPINVKSLKSMKQMQALQPKIKELQQKFKGDKDRLNMETMQLFRAHKVNPMGGCLPMLIQFPIYIALYKVLWSSIELYRAPFFWFYRDLSAPDPYMITPILLGVGMVLQQKMTPTASADPMQQKMMMFMPIMFSVFMLFLPVGLVIYILVNTVMSVTQQWMYNNNIKFRDLIRGKLPAKA